MMKIQPSRLATASALLTLVASTALAQTGGKAGRCTDWTQGRLMGLEYVACQLTARKEMATIQLSRRTGSYDGYGFPETVECRDDLRKTAKKAVDDTRACLLKTKQSRAVDALDDYYAAWLFSVSAWTNMAESAYLFDMRLEALEQSVEEKKIKFTVQLR